MDGIIDSMGTNWSKLQETVKGREAWHATVHGVTESDTTERLNSNKQPPEWLFIKDLNLWGLEPGA